MNDSLIKVTDNRQSPISLQLIGYGILFVTIGILVFIYAINSFLNNDMRSFMMILNILLIISLLSLTICSSSLCILI